VRVCLGLTLLGASQSPSQGVELEILGCPRQSVEVLKLRAGATVQTAEFGGHTVTSRIDIVSAPGEHVVLLIGSQEALNAAQGGLGTTLVQVFSDIYKSKINDPLPDELADELRVVAMENGDFTSRPAGSMVERVVSSNLFVFTIGASRLTSEIETKEIVTLGYWMVLNSSCAVSGVYFLAPPLWADVASDQIESILTEMASY